MEYFEHTNSNGEILKIKLSLSNTKLEGETREEFVFRRAFMKQEVKNHLKGRRIA
jgi:hypothetical protein|tara:strand:- start:78 stop:242 length:165 start_codon:yes stop_codon:yes gene_type:complete